MSIKPETPPRAGTVLPLRLAFAGALFVALGALLTFAAVAPDAMARPLFGGIPLSLVLATLMIAFAVGSTGLYVILANRRMP